MTVFAASKSSRRCRFVVNCIQTFHAPSTASVNGIVMTQYIQNRGFALIEVVEESMSKNGMAKKD